VRSRALFLLLVAALGLSAACAEILGFRPPGHRPFEHRAHVLQGISCTRCHGGVSMAGEEGPLHLPGTRDCVGCHEKPHDDRDCSICHGLPSTRAAAALARQELRFQHSTHMPRVKGNCVRCHLDIETGADVLRPRMATCGSCHEHQAQITTDCDRCHVDIRAEDRKPDDHLIHGPGFLREHAARAAGSQEVCTGCHQESFCAGCHGVTTPALPEHMAFDEPMRAGVHRAGFLARHPEEARTDPGLCTTCHSPNVCSTCHDRERVSVVGGGSSPHPSGWLGPPGQRNDHGRAAWRDPDTCAGCHSGAGEMMCVGCHKVGGVGGNPHPAGWVSRRTPKTDRPCRLCHGNGL
jgi:Cytochrome c7 and related cytochrome c